MPTYRVTSPDGKIYDVTPPDGTPMEEVLAQVQKMHGSVPEAPKPEPEQGLRATTFVDSANPRNLLERVGAGAKDFIPGMMKGVGEYVSSVGRTLGRTLVEGAQMPDPKGKFEVSAGGGDVMFMKPPTFEPITVTDTLANLAGEMVADPTTYLTSSAIL